MRSRLPVVAVALAPLLSSCLAGRPVGGDAGAAGGTTLGSFEVASPTLGERTLAPTECAAGDLQFFLGADLTAPGAPVAVRLAVDPLEGAGVRAYATDAPLANAVVFRQSECAVFHFTLDSTGWRVNHVNDYRLTLEVDCRRPGERIRGHASSTHCH